MPIIRYTAYTRSGLLEKGEIEARSTQHALKELSSKGLLPVEATLAAADQSSSATAASPLGNLPLTELSRLLRQIGVMLKSGVPIDQAIQLLIKQVTNTRTKERLIKVGAGLNTGSPLSDLLPLLGRNVPPYVATLTRAGEARGSTGNALAEIADFLDVQNDLSASIKSALVYPAILIVAMIVVLGVVMTTLVPALMPLFADAGVPPPYMLQLISDGSAVLASQWMVALCLAFALLAGYMVLRKRPAFATASDRVKLALPVFGPLRRDTNLAFLAKTLGTLLRSGVTLVPAMRISSDLAYSPLIRQAMTKATEDVQSGLSLAAAFRNSGASHEVLTGFIEVGESAGKLDEMLLYAANILESDAKDRVDRLMTLLSPAITAIIGLLVGGLILSVSQAVLSINDLANR